MMINNAKEHVKSFDPKSPEPLSPSIGEISEVLTLLTGKLTSDIIIEIGGFNDGKLTTNQK